MRSRTPEDRLADVSDFILVRVVVLFGCTLASEASASSKTIVDTANGASQSLATSDSNKLELLLSLDVALELIHASRDSLKRVETFAGYPGHYGQRVRDTIEEIFILMLQALNERHITPGFRL